MARIAGVDIPDNKRGEISLTYIYGIGKSTAQNILDKAKIDRNVKVKDWTDEQQSDLRNIISEDYTIEGALRSEKQMNIKRLKEIGCYRGIRHRSGMPVRGQKTKNNAKTRKLRRIN